MVATTARSRVYTLDGAFVLITAPANATRCQEIASGRWMPRLNGWVYRATPAAAAAIAREFGADGLGADAEFHAQLAIAKDIHAAHTAIEVADLPDVPNGKQSAWRHQRQAYQWLRAVPSAMIPLGMGAGKSRCVVDQINNDPAIQKVLIIAPKRVVHNVWENQFAQHGTRRAEIALLDRGSSEQKARHPFIRARDGALYVIVVNYEAVWREPLSMALLSQSWDLVVLDESHRIKAPTSAVSKWCAKLAHRAARRICMSGTPLGQGPLDAFGQYRFLDAGVFGTSFTNFRARYAIMGGYGNHEIRGYQRQDEFNQKFWSIAFRPSVTLDLPPVSHEDITAPLDGEALRQYQKLEDEFYLRVADGTITVANALVKGLKLQQYTSGFLKLDDGTITGAHSVKADMLAELVDDLPPAEPLVVFCRFTHDLDIVRVTVERAGRHYGELSGRRDDLQSWQSGKASSVLGVQIQSGGVGVDFTRACYAVYYSTGFSLTDYDQSLKRLDRPGQTRPVHYYHLLLTTPTGSIDQKVTKALQEKRNVIETILAR